MSFSDNISDEFSSNKPTDKELTGNAMNELLKETNEILIKFMPSDNNDEGMIFKTGLNVILCEFNPQTTYCERFSLRSGAIYATTMLFFHSWMYEYDEYSDHFKYCVRHVTLPDDARVIIKNNEHNKLYCDKVILSEPVQSKYFLSSMFEQKIVSYDRMSEYVKKCGYIINYVDKKYRTPEMMAYAVKNDPFLLDLVPQEFRTNEMMMDAIGKNYMVLRFIPHEFITRHMMMISIPQSWDVLSYVNQEFLTNEIMMFAVRNNWRALQVIVEYRRTNEIILEAVKQDYHACKMIDLEQYNEKTVNFAVEIDDMLQFLKNRLETYETLLKILKEKNKPVDFAPNINKNVKIYKRMLNKALEQRNVIYDNQKINEKEKERNDLTIIHLNKKMILMFILILILFWMLI
jgi:hypothetical protein